MMRGLVLTVVAMISAGAVAQVNRAPWVQPFLRGGGSPNMTMMPGAGFKQPGGYGSAPALRPYMGSNGGMGGLNGFQRPRPYMSPWGYNPNYNNGYQRGGSNVFGTLLSGLLGLLGGGGNMFGGNLFGGNNMFGASGNYYGGGNDYYSRPDFFGTGSNNFAPVQQQRQPQPDYYSQRDQTPQVQTDYYGQPYQPPAGNLTGAPDVARPGDDGDFGVTDPSVAAGPPNPADDAVQVVPDQVTPDEQMQINAVNNAERSAQRAPVWRPFLRKFQQCAPGCQPIGYSAWRRSSVSCHGQGRALDLFGMRCADGNHMAINSSRTSGKFARLVQCLSEGRINRVQRLGEGQLGCLWHNGPGTTSGHKDHVHVTIGCQGGRRW